MSGVPLPAPIESTLPAPVGNMRYGETFDVANANYNLGKTESGIITHVPREWFKASSDEAQSTLPKYEYVEKAEKKTLAYKVGYQIGSLLGRFNRLGVKPPEKEIQSEDTTKVFAAEPSVPERSRFMPSFFERYRDTKAEFSDHVDVMNATNIARTNEKFASSLEKSDLPEDRNTLDLIARLPIKSGIRVSERDVFFSDALNLEGRMHCVMYTMLPEGKVAPRLMYKSNSDGDWRVAPYYDYQETADGKENGWYSKGETMDFGYVRETRLDDDIRLALAEREQTAMIGDTTTRNWFLKHFTKEALGSNNTYETEAFCIQFGSLSEMGRIDAIRRDMFAIEPGRGFETKDGRKAREVFESLHFSEPTLPDLASEGKIFATEHPILGKVVTEVITSNDGRFNWHMSSDSEGRVWVSGVTTANKSSPNSYGTDNEVLSMGILDNKPIEYKSQVSGLEDGVDFVDTAQRGYVDITPLLDNLQPVKLYRERRGIVRKRKQVVNAQLIPT
jgi:hypothetical protein